MLEATLSTKLNLLPNKDFQALKIIILKLRPVDVREKIGQELAKHDLEMGCFVNNLIFDRLEMEHSVSQPGKLGEEKVLEIYEGFKKL